MKRLALLEAAIGYSFKDIGLLEQALTHRSHSARHNERLEFLGDSVLNFTVAALLFERFQRIDEGDLSRLRANLVKQAALAEIATRLGLSDYLRLGEGELKSGGFRRPSILADALEAIFGAVFLDAGFTQAQTVITQLYEPMLVDVDPKTLGKDPTKPCCKSCCKAESWICRCIPWWPRMALLTISSSILNARSPSSISMCKPVAAAGVLRNKPPPHRQSLF